MDQSNRVRPAEAGSTWNVDGREVRVTRLDKLFWPDIGITKGELLDYYLDVGATVLLHLRDRPVVLKAYPDGVEGSFYYRQNLPKDAPEWIQRFATRALTTSRLKQMPVVNDRAALVWMANQGAIELHPWLSRIENPWRPDQVMMDLDVESADRFALTLEAALLIRSELEAVDLRAFVKTSGGNGLHIVLPIAPKYTFEETRDWVRSVADRVEERYPKLFTTLASRRRRAGRVLVDYAQNSFGKTTVAPYSARPRPGATVSAPLRWPEVEGGQVLPGDFTVRTMRERLREVGDLLAPALSLKQRLPLGEP